MVKQNKNRIFFPREWINFRKELNRDNKLGYKKYNSRMLYELQMNTGARFNEASNVKVRDIDFENKNINLRIVKARTPYSSGIPRTIPISTKFRNRLYEYVKKNELKDSDFLGVGISQAGYNQLLKNKLRKAGIKDWNNFSSHNIRKTLETWLVALDVGSLKILKHFGHDKATALKHYIQIDLFSIDDKILIRKIIDDLYINISDKEAILSKEILNIKGSLRTMQKELKQLKNKEGAEND